MRHTTEAFSTADGVHMISLKRGQLLWFVEQLSSMEVPVLLSRQIVRLEQLSGSAAVYFDQRSRRLDECYANEKMAKIALGEAYAVLGRNLITKARLLKAEGLGLIPKVQPLYTGEGKDVGPKIIIQQKEEDQCNTDPS